MLRGCSSSQQAAGLDMARGSLETGGAFVQVAVDTDVAKFPVLEAGFMVTEVVTSKRRVVVAASPPDFGVNKGGFFFFSQGR